MRIRVLIADDHAVVREGLARLVEEQPDMRVVAQAADGEAALALAIEHEPHVILLDMRMPGLGGVAAVKRVRERCPWARVLVLSMYEDAHYVRAALAAGAHAYLGKRTSATDLLAAIRALYEGRALEPAAEQKALDVQSLSAREREIMQMVIEGQTSKQMASALGISKSSVDTYRARVFRKLGVDSRSALFRLHGEREGESP
jgi:DNA-binding NarL/FixJ family response regulator